MSLSHTLCHIQHTVYEPSHIFQFFALEIIFGYADIRFHNLASGSILPRSESHILFLCICPLDDKFRSGMSVHRIVHFVLHFLKKKTCRGSILVIIYCSGINIGQLLIETTFAQTYLSDFSKQMLEVIFSDKRAVLHTLLIHNIATDCKLAYDAGTPLTELRGTDGIYAIAYGDDGIEVVELCKIVLSVSGSCRDFLGN